jgi:hypothetical protein
MQQLFELVHKNGGRLILSGDTRQHGPVESCDALRAIEMYSGLKAAELKTIRRQDPKLAKTQEEKQRIQEYRRAVGEARSGKLKESFDRLNKNGVITQCGLSEQQDTLAKHFLELAATGCSTVIVSQTWSEILKVNDRIREGLKERGLIGKEDTIITTLQRLDLTNAQKRDSRFYSETSVIVFNQDVAGFKKGDQGRLLHLNESYLFVEAGKRIKPIPFKHLDRISVCEPKEMALAVGDRLQLKANARAKTGQSLANGEIVVVKRIGADGRIVLEDGRVLEKNYRQFVRGYAVTSYAAQGKTADYVIFSDSAIKAATNQKQWYVTISRGRKGIRIFTTDKTELRENVVRSGNRELALELAGEPSASRGNLSLKQHLRRFVDFVRERMKLPSGAKAPSPRRSQSQHV